MMRKFNIKPFYTNILCAEKFVDSTLQACRIRDPNEKTNFHQMVLNDVERCLYY